MIQQSHSWAYIQKRLKTLIWKDKSTPMFLTALFMISKIWKCSIEEWIKKMWCIYTMEYYSAFKKNEIKPFVATWMDLEIIILSEISQTRTNTIGYHLYVESKKKKEIIYKTVNRLIDIEKLMVTTGKQGQREG